ncbi:MAG: TSUP family transporter [Betaproteobacteria bacterium]
MPTPEMLLLAALITAATYSVFGLTGAGSTALALPLLAHFLPLKFAVPLLMLLDLAASLALSTRARGRVRMDEFGRLVPFLLAGIALGLTLLIKLPEGPLLAALGAFLLAYGAWCLSRKPGAVRLSRGWAAPIGLVGGALSALFGTGGVLTTLYFTGRLTAKDELRATSAAAVLLNSATRLVLFGATGLLTQEGLLFSGLLLLPSVAVGLFVGQRLHAVVAAAGVLRAVYVVLLLAGLSLLARYIPAL